MAETAERPRSWIRDAISLVVAAFSIAIIIVIVIVSKDAANKDYVQTLNIVLPLVATWMGTVLAFYFSKENFQAANDSITRLIGTVGAGSKAPSISARAKMLPIKNVTSLELAGRTAKDLGLVKEVLALMKKDEVNRLLILDGGKALYAVHRSIVDRFLGVLLDKGGADKVGLATLADLLDDPDSGPYVKDSLVFASPTETLEALRAKMEKRTNCLDAVVTEDGGPEGPALGWLTDKMVLEAIGR